MQSARVTAVPVNGSPRRDLYKSANSAADGTFTLSTLPPGSYKLYAWEDVEEGAWLDDEFLKPFLNKSTSFNLKEGDKHQIQVEVIPVNP